MPRPQPYHVVLAGIDTLIVNARGTLNEDTVNHLDASQQEAIALRDARTQHDEVRVVTAWTLAEQPLLIAPHGGGKGLWRWLVSCPAVTLEIGEGGLNGICLRARLSSSFLWEYGYRAAWEATQAVLDTLGAFSYQPSEVHLCADVAGLNVADVRQYDFVRRGHVTRWHQEDVLLLDVVERSKASGEGRTMLDVVQRYREQETLNFSLSAPHACVVYNKPREIRLKSRDKVWFADLWRRNGWNGSDPVARIENRYERDVLHTMVHAKGCTVLGCDQLHGIDTMDDLFAHLDTMWRYSTRDWLRHTVPTKDLKHRKRWPTSPWWQVVQSASFGHPDAFPAQRERVQAFRELQMFGAVMGYLESWTAWRSGEQLDPTVDIWTALNDIGQRVDAYYKHKDTDFLSEVRRKRKKLGFLDDKGGKS